MHAVISFDLKEIFFFRSFFFWGNKQMSQASDFKCLCESDAQDFSRKSMFWIWLCCHILSGAALLCLTMYASGCHLVKITFPLCCHSLFIYKIDLVVWLVLYFYYGFSSWIFFEPDPNNILIVHHYQISLNIVTYI